MTDETRNQKGGVTTVSRDTTTQKNFETLTPLEEKVLRMLHGLSEDDGHELSFALGANDEERARLARLEKHLLDAFEWGEMASFDVEKRHVEAKEKIIDKLRDL